MRPVSAPNGDGRDNSFSIALQRWLESRALALLVPLVLVVEVVVVVIGEDVVCRISGAIAEIDNSPSPAIMVS